MGGRGKKGRAERKIRDHRGWLSKIDMLPEECDDDIAWANRALRDRTLPQVEILNQFNARIAEKGQKPISRSAFSRHSIRAANEARKVDASRRITDAILARLTPGERSEAMIAATELLKYRVLEMVVAEDDPDPKLLGVAALSLQRLSSTASRESDLQRRDRQEHRQEEERVAEEEARAVAEKVAADAVADAAAKLASEAGLNSDRIAALRRGVLGLKV